MLTVHQRHGQTDRQTDGQTDGRTTHDSNTALALRASRGKKMSAASADMICGSKLGLTMVRLNLQSVSEPPALDQPPVSKHVRQICGIFFRFLTSGDLELWTFQLKIGTPFTHALGNVYSIILDEIQARTE